MRAGAERGWSSVGRPWGPPQTWRLGRGDVHTLTVRPGAWQSGLYFARLTAPGGRAVTFAPFILRAAVPGVNRIAIVLPTYTWQAYNFYDANGDGKPDSWYGDPKRHSVSLGRPVPQLGEAAALPHAAARVPALPRAHGQAGGLPLRRRPREVRLGRRPREALRPRHLLGSRGIRDAADLRRRAALPRSRRQPRVSLGEQLLPARRAVEREHLARPALARRRPARVGADRRPVRRQRPWRPRGAVRRHAAGRGAVVVQRHLGRGRHAALNGALRDRVRRDHTVLAARARSCSQR